MMELKHQCGELGADIETSDIFCFILNEYQQLECIASLFNIWPQLCEMCRICVHIGVYRFMTDVFVYSHIYVCEFIGPCV